jgi:Na+-transporting NADH:ubiquinone oxidoreductase subunit C
MAKESIGRTISVAAGVCVVCSVFVSTASVALKERQEINKKLDKRKNILRAAGVLGEQDDVRDLLKKRIEEGVLEKDATLDDLFYNEVDEQWVCLETGEFVDEKEIDPGYAEERKAAKDPRLRVEIAPAPGADRAGFKYKAPLRRIYFTKESAGGRRIILPMAPRR